MGGIIGKLTFDRDVQISSATVQRMIDAVAHRAGAAGDHRASYVGQGIALGACDDTASPFAHVAQNEAGTVRAVADSELSNARSLRRILEDRGHLIHGSGDAELIAHAYEEWGDACVERFSGPFACAIWDEMQRRLVLARDHFGIRPLCFALLHGDGVVFGSEIKALLKDPSVGREWHPEAIDAYLALGCIPAPLTIHRQVSKLEPAHTLVAEGRRLTTRRYWKAHPDALEGPSEREAIELLEARLLTSVGSPTDDASVLTSGGLASTAIATMMSRGATCLTVQVDRDPLAVDRISSMASHLGLRSVIDRAILGAPEIAGWLARRFDEPTAEPAAVSQYLIFATARRHTNVALTGYGLAFWSGAPERVLFEESQRHAVYTRRFSRQVANADPVGRFRDVESGGRLIELAVPDGAATAAGLRLRHPLLQHELVDLGCTRPRHLMTVAARVLPAAILPRFQHTAPTPSWLSQAVARLVPHVLLGERLETRDVFSRPALRTLWDEHQTGECDHARRLWAVLMLECWFRELVDGDAAEQPATHAVLVRAA